MERFVSIGSTGKLFCEGYVARSVLYQFWCFEQCYVDDIDVVFLVRRVNKRHQS